MKVDFYSSMVYRHYTYTKEAIKKAHGLNPELLNVYWPNMQIGDPLFIGDKEYVVVDKFLAAELGKNIIWYTKPEGDIDG